MDAARKRSGMLTRQEEEDAKKNRRVYDWETDTFLDESSVTSPTPSREENEVNPRTRGILDKVKESTMALQDLNSQVCLGNEPFENIC